MQQQPSCSPAVCAQGVHRDAVLLLGKKTQFLHKIVWLGSARSAHCSSFPSQESRWTLSGQRLSVLHEKRVSPMQRQSPCCRSPYLLISRRGKPAWGLKEQWKLLSSEIFETRQCLNAEDWGIGSSPAQLLRQSCSR